MNTISKLLDMEKGFFFFFLTLYKDEPEVFSFSFFLNTVQGRTWGALCYLQLSFF